MKIEYDKDYKPDKDVYFDDLDEGVVFSYEGDYYIKTDENSSVMIENGYVDDSINHEMVRPINAVFLVRGDE